MPYGNRKSERVRFEHRYPVNLMGVDGTWRRSCVLLDASATGARLEVEGSLDVLQAHEFFLILSCTGLAFRRCELVRVTGAEVGGEIHHGKETEGKSGHSKVSAPNGDRLR